MGRYEGELERLLYLLRLLVDGGEGLEGLGDRGVLPYDLQAHLLRVLHVASRKSTKPNEFYNPLLRI